MARIEKQDGKYLEIKELTENEIRSRITRLERRKARTEETIIYINNEINELMGVLNNE